jgi:transcriptional regulator with XRE-family HTH domain
MKAIIDGPRIEDKIVGANIRRLRLQKGKSQTELGLALGITFQQVQKYEKGTNRVSASRLVQMARYFGCTIDELFRGIELKKAQGTTSSQLIYKNPKVVKFLKLIGELAELEPKDADLVLSVAMKMALMHHGRQK